MLLKHACNSALLCRDELNRLTGILNSRVGDLSNADSEEKTQNIAIKREGKEVVLVHENRRMSIEEKQDGWVGARVGTSTPLLPLAVSIFLRQLCPLSLVYSC